MIKNITAIFLVLICSVTNSYAVENTHNTNVEKYVHKLITDSLVILNDTSLDSKKKTSKVKEMLGSNLDSGWMAKFVLGRAVKTLPKDKLEKFVSTYEKYLVSSYANAVSAYKGEKVDIRSLDTLSDGFYMVKTQVVKVGGNFINVEYLAHEVNGTYKICDVITEGISLVNSQRSEYSSTIENEGLESLIHQLAKRTK